MIKNNKWKLTISSVVILLPVLLAVFGGSFLPEKIAVHWGFDGNANGWMNASAIFWLLPVILLVLHWACILLSISLDKNAEQNKKVMEITFWIMPAISLMTCGTIFAAAFGYTANLFSIVYLFFAVLFIVIGNYLPKTKRNITMGIKIKWALSNDENWNATHRFAGKVYVVTGFLCLLAIPLPLKFLPFVFTMIILACVIPPVVYSYRFYKRQLAEGKITREESERGYRELFKNKKTPVIVTVIMVALLVIFLPIIMFTGSIETTLDESSLTVEASFWNDLTLDYEDIDAIEYRENSVDGSRINGIGSARLLIGFFKNEEFGVYTRYTYTGDRPCVVLTADDRTVVIGAEEEATVMEIYERVLAEISK